MFSANRKVCLGLRTILAAPIVLALSGCSPYAPLIGETFTRIDEYRGTQRDEVPVVLGGTTIRGIKLVRHKAHGRIEGHFVRTSFVFPEYIKITSVTFDGGTDKLKLFGVPELVDVDARSYGVFYKTHSTFPVLPEQIRQLAEFDEVLVSVSGVIDYGPIKLGPKGLDAIDVYYETFVIADGIGRNVSRASIGVSD